MVAKQQERPLSKPNKFKHTFVQSVKIFELWDRVQDQPNSENSEWRVIDQHG